MFGLTFTEANILRDQINKVLNKVLPDLVKKQVQAELHQGSMSIPTPSADAVLQNGIHLASRAKIQTTDAYGRVIMNQIPNVISNHSLYQRMKNKIQYGVKTDMIGLNNKDHFINF